MKCLQKNTVLLQETKIKQAVLLLLFRIKIARRLPARYYTYALICSGQLLRHSYLLLLLMSGSSEIWMQWCDVKTVAPLNELKTLPHHVEVPILSNQILLWEGKR